MANSSHNEADTPTEQMPGGSPTPPSHGGNVYPGTGGLGFSVNPSVPPQDLSQDKLLATAPRASVADGKHSVPALGGIPLMAKLGQGGMGAVYYGIHPRLQSEVAVKVLPFNLADQQPEMVDRFFREAQVAAQINSPNLVAVMDVNEESGLYYIVMEFVRGASAGAYLRELTEAGQTGAPEATALDICLGASEGMAAAHEQGVIHRDIKLDNVMIPMAAGCEELLFPKAKLTDLGLARGEEIGKSLTGTQATMGTPGYMAPEQGMDAKRAGKPADVFSMGATLYALLAGEAPFAGSAIMKILMDTAYQPHVPIRERRPDVSAATATLIDRCLAKDPQERFPDAASLLEALRISRGALGRTDAEQRQAVSRLTGIQATAPGSAGNEAVIPPRPVAQAPSLTHVTPPQIPPQPAPSPAPVAVSSISESPSEQTPKSGSAWKVVAVLLVLIGLGAGGWFVKEQKEQAEKDRIFKSIGDAAREAERIDRTDRTAVQAAVTRLTALESKHTAMDEAALRPLRENRNRLAQHLESLIERKKRFEGMLATARALIVVDPESALKKISDAEELGQSDPDAGMPDLAKDSDLADLRLQAKKSQERISKEKRKHDFEVGYAAARDAAKNDDWKSAGSTLERILKLISDDEHPAKSAAAALLVKTKKELDRRARYAAKSKEIAELLGKQQWEKAKAAIESAIAMWPDAPDLATRREELRSIGEALKQKKLSDLLQNLREKRKAQAWTEALENLRQAEALAPRSDIVGKERTALLEGLHAAGTKRLWGEGIERDVKKGIALLQRGADLGHTPSLSTLGVVLLRGELVPGDEARARKLLTQAAAQKDAVSQHHLGVIYEEGRGVERDAKRAVKWFQEAAGQGFAPAMTNLGWMYEYGHGVAEDPKQATIWYEKAAKQGEVYALGNLADVLARGKGVEKDVKRSVSLLRKALAVPKRPLHEEHWFVFMNGSTVPKAGQPLQPWQTACTRMPVGRAKCILGLSYDMGTGIEENAEKAVQYYREAAEQGLAAAQHNLASMYRFGKGVPKDESEAANWYRKSAEQGFPYAQVWLADLYRLGNGVEKDPAEAAKWFRKAADQGHAHGQYGIGMSYALGEGVAKDEKVAAKWFRKAADQGHSEAEFYLGWFYDQGQGVPESRMEALKWFRKAAAQGHARAQLNLGFMYKHGRGVTKDYAEAAKWYRKAADLGLAEAQFELGLLYVAGHGVAKDEVKAVKWFRSAADQGLSGAQCFLGVCFSRGMGVPQDFSEALQWLRKAAAQGDIVAQNEIGLMYSEGRGVAQNHVEAVRWYRMAAEAGDPKAQLNLGMKYAKGEGVAKDFGEARRWFLKAAGHGNPEAELFLGVMYFNGEGVRKDRSIGIEWLKKAARHGNRQAQRDLRRLNVDW